MSDLKIDNSGKVDEVWLDAVLRDNSERVAQKKQLSQEFGKVCVRFVDAVLCNPNFGYVRLDKLTKMEVCSRVYLHLCKKVTMYSSGKSQKASSWMFTVVKNAIHNAVRQVIKEDEVSDIVAMVVGSETLNKLDGIDRSAPLNQMLSERMNVMSDYILNNSLKESIWGHASSECRFFRDGRSLVDRARKHKELQAFRMASQMELSDGQREEIKKLLEERKNGK